MIDKFKIMLSIFVMGESIPVFAIAWIQWRIETNFVESEAFCKLEEFLFSD